MKIEIDKRHVDPKNAARSEPWFALRLYPENNREMADMEWSQTLALQPARIERITVGDQFHYVVVFAPSSKN